MDIFDILRFSGLLALSAWAMTNAAELKRVMRQHGLENEAKAAKKNANFMAMLVFFGCAISLGAYHLT